MLFRCVAAVALSCSLTAIAQAQFIKDDNVVDDTFIDSSAVGMISNGYDQQSYGSDAKVKAVSSNTVDSMSGTATNSFTHVLFKVPQDVIDRFSSGVVTKVTVSFYPVNDSLSMPSQANPTDDGDDYLELHPLAPNTLAGSFTIGNGTQSPLKYSTSGGATWFSRDGKVNANNQPVNPWSTPGGDFDSTSVKDTNYLNAVTTGNFNLRYPVSKGSVPFSWDVTSLMNTDPSQSDLETFGGLIKLPNDPNYSAYQIQNQTQDFVSLNSSQATSLVPYFEITYTPEPATVGIAVLGFPLLLRRRARRSGSVI